MYQCDGVTAGNVLTLKNQLNAGSSTHRIDANLKVVGASFDGVRRNIIKQGGSSRIEGAHGALSFFRSGFYVYVSAGSDPIENYVERFILHLENSKGVTEDVPVKIFAYDTAQSANAMADYGHDQYGPNTRVDGYAAYQTRMTEGVILLSATRDDMLIGSISSDAILSWKEADHILGMEGDDFIAGEQGANRVAGGPGADFFSIDPDKGFTNGLFDTIEDFNPKEGDVISLADPLAMAWGMKNSDPKDSRQRIWTETTDDHLDVYLKAPVNKGMRHLVRIEAHDHFNPTKTNFLSLIELGNIVL